MGSGYFVGLLVLSLWIVGADCFLVLCLILYSFVRVVVCGLPIWRLGLVWVCVCAWVCWCSVVWF